MTCIRVPRFTSSQHYFSIYFVYLPVSMSSFFPIRHNSFSQTESFPFLTHPTRHAVAILSAKLRIGAYSTSARRRLHVVHHGEKIVRAVVTTPPRTKLSLWRDIIIFSTLWTVYLWANTIIGTYKIKCRILRETIIIISNSKSLWI